MKIPKEWLKNAQERIRWSEATFMDLSFWRLIVVGLSFGLNIYLLTYIDNDIDKNGKIRRSNEYNINLTISNGNKDHQ